VCFGAYGVTDVNGLREKGEKERGSRSSLVEGLAETSEHTVERSVW